MAKNVAPLMQELDSEDFYLLSAVEHGMRFSEWVDRSKIPKFAGFDANETEYRLNRCLEFELIERRTIQYEGYRLRFEGYDALALRAFSERGTLQSVGSPIGEGKESDVFEARDSTSVALKFHREGLTNFREVHRAREYTADRSHTSWVYTARKGAEREYEVLESLHPAVSVPEPIDHNRHAIVMELIDGVELSTIGLPENQVRVFFDAIISELATSVSRGFIHTDLSEYNVLVTESGPVLIDWPQAVPTDHPNADELLERDLTNLASFFRRKYPAQMSDLDEGELLSRITPT